MPTLPLTLSVDAHVLVVLDRYIAIHRPGCSRADIVAEVLAGWAADPARAAAPDEGLHPDELNASNDS